MERKIIILLTLVMIGIGMSGCGVKNIPNEQPKQEQSKKPTELDTISKLEGIAFVLGCMFDPAPCQEKKALEKTEDNK